MSDSHAVVVLPPMGAIPDDDIRAWLSRGSVSRADQGTETFDRVLGSIDAPVPGYGLAALRYWGQTGERPDGWLCAADPAHFETRMRDLVLRSLLYGAPSADELQEIVATLQETLGVNDGLSFEAVEDFAYLRAAEPIGTATVSVDAADGAVPDAFTPEDAAARPYHQLQAELQMLLHDHPVNQRRDERGIPRVSTLWFWGGGEAPVLAGRELPPLFGNDPLYCGYWRSSSGTVHDWRSDLDYCVANAAGDFVAVARFENDREGTEFLIQLRAQLRQGRLSRATLHFADRLEIKIKRTDALRFWRGISPLLKGEPGDE